MTYILSELVNRTLTILTVDTTLANENYVPHLSTLGTSASSVPVESLFSITGLVLNSRRSSLKPHKMNKTIFLHDNFNLIKDNVAAPAVMQCDAQEREPESCEPTPGPSWL